MSLVQSVRGFSRLWGRPGFRFLPAFHKLRELSEGGAAQRLSALPDVTRQPKRPSPMHGQRRKDRTTEASPGTACADQTQQKTIFSGWPAPAQVRNTMPGPPEGRLANHVAGIVDFGMGRMAGVGAVFAPAPPVAACARARAMRSRFATSPNPLPVATAVVTARCWHSLRSCCAVDGAVYMLFCLPFDLPGLSFERPPLMS